MPRVPSYDNLQTQVAVQPSVQFQAPSGPTAGGIAAEQGAQMGRAVQGLGADMNKLALAAAEQANQVRVTDAMNQAMSARLKLTYDPQVGYTQKRGQAALDPDADGKPMDQSYGDQLRTRLDEIAKGLGNDAQRAVFAQQSGQVVQQFNAGLTSHVAKEYADHAVSVQQGTTKLAQDQMGLAWGDATAIEQSRTAIKASVAEEGRLRGWAPQMVEAATREQLSAGYESSVAMALQAGQVELASVMLDNAKKNGELTDTALQKLTGQVKSVDVQVRGDKAADATWTQYAPKDVNDPVRIFDMERDIREKFANEPQLKDAALKGLKERAATFNAQQTEINAGGINKVYGMIDAGASLAKVKSSPAWLALPEAKRHEITKGLEAEAATRASRAASDSSRLLSDMVRKDKLQLWNNQADYLHDSDPDVLTGKTRTQVEAMRTTYGFEGTQSLLQRWDLLQNKDAKLMAKMDDSQFKAVVKDTLDIDAYKVSNVDTKAMLGNLKVRVDSMLTQRAQQLRRPLTPDEKTQLMREETAKEVTLGQTFWRGESTKPAAVLTPADAARVVVPPADRTRLLSDLQKAYNATGLPEYAPTQDNLRRLYLKEVSPLAGLPDAPK
jgi:hypothetical protein